MNIVFTDHAVQQIFERNLFEDDVILAVLEGEVIKEYPNDKPYPSCLKLFFTDKKPIHVVVAENRLDQKLIIITAYEPEKSMWTLDFKTKLKQ